MHTRATVNRLIALVKSQIELALSSAVRTFLILFLGLTFVGPVLASLMVFPLSWSQWLRHEWEIVVLASFAASLVWLKRTSPWLGWLGAVGVSTQMLVGLLFLYAQIGTSFGLLYPNTASPVTHYPFTAYTTAWAVLALACAWGMVKDNWRAYFGEIAVILLVLAAVYLGPDPSPGEHHARRPPLFAFEAAIRPFMDWVETAAYCWGLAALFWALYRRGRERFSVGRAIGHSL